MIVAQDGSGNFTTVQEAIDAIPKNNTERVIIFIKNGVYKEKLYIDKPLITLKGEDPEKTILTFDDYARKIMENGEEMGTFRTSSSFIGGNDFIAENIHFENSAGDGRTWGQAVAAYVDADRVVFRNCIFTAYQDTLFTGPLPSKPKIPGSFKGPGEGKVKISGRQYYENCRLVGDVDFIFGSAIAVFHQCTIFSRNRDMDVNGYITAASTPKDQEYGYVFLDCRLESDAKENTVYLGRPWREYAHVAFLNCWMDQHIKCEGWDNWRNEENEKTAKYYEYKSYGPGARLKERVKWAHILTEEEAENYKIEKVLAGSDGWNPQHI
ncbi:MAG: pectin methylesterase [Epulopiscium sp.]|nr:pectin methylesterase [Candidatus Epulonipiscium sp.]